MASSKTIKVNRVRTPTGKTFENSLKFNFIHIYHKVFSEKERNFKLMINIGEPIHMSLLRTGKSNKVLI